MEYFEAGKTIRLKGRHGKYLCADADGQKIVQEKDPRKESVWWRVEHDDDSSHIRLKNYSNDTYLTASENPFLLGMTGKRVIQSQPKLIDSFVEWEPISDCFLVKLKSCHGQYLRANGGVPPWRNSVTHDIPHRQQKHQEWLLWGVETVYGLPEDQGSHYPPVIPIYPPTTPRPPEGRKIFYAVANSLTEAKNLDPSEWPSFTFSGQKPMNLKKQLQEVTGIDEEIQLYARHLSTSKLYELRLNLPPNNHAMHIVVVKAGTALTRSITEVNKSSSDDSE